MEENSPKDERWERQVLERLALDALAEQRRSRRWGIFFKLLGFGYLFILLMVALSGPSGHDGGRFDGEYTAMVTVEGVISDATDASATHIIEGLRDAFKAEGTRGVVLRINSPGGSPVQADDIYNEIRRLRVEHPAVPVHAVIVDLGASAAYYIASAADNIYANPGSLVGSIGVLINSFGFTGMMEKFGVERRLLTAGEHKGMLDPFSPMPKEDIAFTRTILNTLHQQFIDAVKRGRGDRLGDDPTLFSGRFWDGRKGRELGLVDDFGNVDYVAREVIGAEKVVDFTPAKDLWERVAQRMGEAMASTFATLMGVDGARLR